MTFQCEHCKVQFDSFFLLTMHLANTVADSLGEIAALLPSGHPESVSPITADELSHLRAPFEPPKTCEKRMGDHTCTNEAEVLVKWTCGECSLLMCAPCLLALVATAQAARHMNVPTIAPCHEGREHDLSQFHHPIAV